MKERKIDIKDNPEILEALGKVRVESLRIKEEVEKNRHQMDVLSKEMGEHVKAIENTQDQIWDVIYKYHPELKDMDCIITEEDCIIVRGKKENSADDLNAMSFLKLLRKLAE